MIVVDIVLCWVALFGVWPFADPGHDMTSLLSVLDVVLHFAAMWWLASRWRLVRRVRPRRWPAA